MRIYNFFVFKENVNCLEISEVKYIRKKIKVSDCDRLILRAVLEFCPAAKFVN